MNSREKQLALSDGKQANTALSYNLAAQLYADLRALRERASGMDERLNLQIRNNESLKFQLAQKQEMLAEINNNLNALAAREAGWKKERIELLKKHAEEKRLLEEKIKKIQGFHSYRLGQFIMESQKGWGRILGVFVGYMRYQKKLFQDQKNNKAQLANAQLLSGGAATLPPFKQPQGAKLKVAAIMDEFTRNCYAPDCDLLELEPAIWKKQLKSFKPDLLFIESAWQGRNELWKLKVSNFDADVQSLVAWCKKKRIPVMFWNKEDPAHYSTFLPLAKAADFIFTTDFDRIAHYKKDVGHDRVYLLPFAAQPGLHNPLEKYERKPGFCFAGSYYLKYADRQRDFAALAEAISSISRLDIYDRNYGKDHPHYKFPELYQDSILGKLPYAEMDRAYKGYDFGVNMNSVKQSQSMFARRVYELAASNTMVISNFSRGLRNFFGDLVISSDQPAELRGRILPFLENRLLYRKQRLAALRHVFLQHTYAHRINYIKEKIWQSAPPAPAKILLFSRCANQDEAERAIRAFKNQTWPAKELLLVGLDRPESVPREKNIIWTPDLKSCERIMKSSRADFLGELAPGNHYGENYLLDLALAASWSAAPAFGKAARYVWRNDEALLENDGAQYRPSESLPAFASIARKERFQEFWNAANGNGFLAGIALDEFNFVENGADLDRALLEPARDLEIADKGVSFRERMIPLAEKLPPASDHSEDKPDYSLTLPHLSPAQMAEMFPSTGQITISEDEGGMLVQSALAPDKHAYVHAEPLPRAELNLVDNSSVNIDAAGDLQLQFAFTFLNGKKEKISHSIVRPGNNTLPVPLDCEFVQISLRAAGSGQALVKSIVFGQLSDEPELILCRGDTLVVAKQYPAYDDLYKYGFLHSRLRKYKEAAKLADMFRLKRSPVSYSEYEDIDVATGDLLELDKLLASGQIKTVAAHLIDRQTWEVLKKHLNHIRVVIWIHGAEIQHWKRRQFEFALMDEAQIGRQKKRSDYFMQLWREILDQPSKNLEFVIVSETFKKECEEDVGSVFPPNSCHVIHNFIDSGIFPYREKEGGERFNVISIRPYYSLTYANDLTVKAILELSRRDGFDKFSFTIAGDGPLFDETVAPLRNLANVKIEKGFLPQRAMAKKYRDFGILLSPTRSDTQGVSRDEAMSSGLVPVTSRVASIPEFVDESCAFLAPAENYRELANAIEKLAADGELFKKMSRLASRRAQSQSGYAQTIKRELELLFGAASDNK